MNNSQRQSNECIKMKPREGGMFGETVKEKQFSISDISLIEIDIEFEIHIHVTDSLSCFLSFSLR